jgi:hypothetical protein
MAVDDRDFQLMKAGQYRGTQSPFLVWFLAWTTLTFVACASACNSSSTPSDTSKGQETVAAPAVETRPVTIRSHIGFASHQKLVEHYQKHGREFGSISMDAYLRQAQELRDQPAGGGVLESVQADGVISRFDRASGAFIAFNPNRVIRTYFRPNDGEAYFRRQARRNE